MSSFRNAARRDGSALENVKLFLREPLAMSRYREMEFIDLRRIGTPGINDTIDFKIMFLGCVIGRRGITIQLPPYSLAKNIILKSIYISFRICYSAGTKKYQPEFSCMPPKKPLSLR
jgi:hypothetical protein